MKFHFTILVLTRLIIIPFFSSGIIVSSACYKFSSQTGLSLTTLSSILSHKFTSCFSGFMELFLEAYTFYSIRASSPDLVTASKFFFPYLLDRFIANDKNRYSLMHFFSFMGLQNNGMLLSSKSTSFLFINKQCQINFVFYFQLSTILIRKCYYNFIKHSVVSFQ